MDPLRVLLQGLVDYAGLFPPASLPMSEAVQRYYRYRQEEYAFALGHFVIPVGRLREFEQQLPDDASGWRLAVLAALPLEPELDQLTAFHTRTLGVAMADSIEVKATSEDEVAAIAAQAPAGMNVYVELPLDDRLPGLISRVHSAGLCAKIRTGGVTPESIPPSWQVARFLSECARRECAFKATAGLHHPVRSHRALTYAPESPQNWMHGFLNVFTAAALAQKGIPEGELTELLEDSQPGSFWRDGDAIGWRHHRLPAEELSSTRTSFAASFGSCSFEEPLAGLREMGWL
jgi:hypothetical protein